MKRIGFNDGWNFGRQREADRVSVPLPHDAMIHEQRAADAPGGSGHGYFPGGIYVYEKTFTAPADWADKTVLLEFEGVYHHSTVCVNGKQAGGRAYGYVPFTVYLDGLLNYGGENTITVTADNSQLPNSRWYTGSGIYRPVHLLVAEKDHIQWQGVRITTLSHAPARVRVQTAVSGEGEVAVEIWDGAQKVASGTGTDLELGIPNAKLWSNESPYLYTCKVTISQSGCILDEAEETFGIRTIEWNSKGLFINGKSTLLRGGCIHHDNGILGAATFDESEDRRVRILKEAGFNALRSAHNPASRALLEACDKYGMYLMDETFDMWYNRKNKFDYGCDFAENWQQDTQAMVERDYNHPSVILYSIGNEVAEPFEQKGVDAGRAQIDFIHSLDTSRPVTCGVNLMIIGRAAKGKGVYQDGEMNSASSGKKQKEGGNASLAFNIMASFIGTGMNKGGNSKRVDALTSPFLDSLDIAGYNYASGRYPLEGKAHPERIVFGSETFPQDIYKNWKMVEQYPYLIGDFMWAAWDYLGEAGIGAWSYNGGMPFNRPYPWLLSGAGVVDILGVPDVSCRYAQVVWGLRGAPVIGVRPVNHPGVRPSKSVWRATNAVESWSWQGCEGNKAQVEVYARAHSVELYLNGKSLGKKRLKEYKAMFLVRYQPGTLTAVSYDEAGRELSRSELRSATGRIGISIKPEKESARPGEILYVPVALADGHGVVESNSDRTLTVRVEGGELLAFGSANPCTQERYDTGRFTTYQGRALAVVRAGATGEVIVSVTDGEQKQNVNINIVTV